MVGRSLKRALVALFAVSVLLIAQIDWTKQVKNIPAYVTNALPDPGANGLVKRTAANTSTAATNGVDYYSPGLSSVTFISGTLPGSPTVGQLAVDSSTNTPKIYTTLNGWMQLGTNGAVYSYAYSSVGQSIANVTQVPLTFDTNIEDSNNGATLVHSTSTNTSRFTIPVGASGRYLLAANVNYSANGIPTYMTIRVNGSTFVMQVTSNTATLPTSPMVSMYLFLNAGDYVEFLVNQTSGSTQTLSAGRLGSWGQIIRIS
jgi:hypothetical protein